MIEMKFPKDKLLLEIILNYHLRKENKKNFHGNKLIIMELLILLNNK